MTKTTLHQKRKKNNPRASQRGRRGKGDAVATYASDAWSLAKRTAIGLNEIRKFINIETKFVDVNGNDTSAQAGTVTYLNPIAQGTNLSDRIADSIRVQGLWFAAAAAVNTNNSSLRIIIVKDNENGGAAPAGSDILQNAGGAGAALSAYNYINRDRFTIVFDELMVLNTVSPPTDCLKYESSLNFHIKFRGTGATAASAAEGSLWLVTLTDLAATQPTLRYTMRVLYTDD